MQDLFDEENPAVDQEPQLPEAEPKHTGPTGPTSPEGKAKSSMNRLDHGCCSEKTVLPDEDPAEFDHCVNSWFTQYEPESASDIVLVQETARACWFFKRASKRLEECEYRLPGDAHHWTDEHHKRYSNFSRYKTTNERSFTRFHRELQASCGRHLRAEEAYRDAQLALSRIHSQWLSKKEERIAEELRVKQWVEVDIVQDQCKTSCYPPNEYIIEKAAKQRRLPVFVSRIIRFADGVPPEYAWTYPNRLQEVTETTAIQKMSYSNWLEVIAGEKVA